MARRSVFAAAIAFFFLLFFSNNARAVYIWVDEKGQEHITDYPKPENPAAQASSYEEKVREDAPPVQSTSALKADRMPSAGESVPQPNAVAAPVAEPRKNLQSIPPPTARQPRLDTAPTPTPAVTTPPVPASVDVESGTGVPQQAVPFDKDAQAMALRHGGAPQMIRTFISMFFYVLIVGYLYFSLCLYLIARKLNVAGAWISWVPLFQIIPFLESASRPVWWALLFFIPFVNMIVPTYLWMCITENLGKGKWFGLLMLVPVVNLIVLGMLAFSGQGRHDDVNVAVS